MIGPAFNEEANIIESVNSLLNLHYPDHELIIVNDGSSDQTLHRLIEYFKLEKVDVIMNAALSTQPVRGIYRNSSFPKLTVVDKLNGGKADSLNAGINIATREYFCGIDADSLLSDDALLKIVSTSLDVDSETVAVGGNIFPVNGCSVNRGVLETIGTPKNALANFQFVEYLRAFMAGRIGWAYLDSLLIISGAFGLFKRNRVVECGGYLTGRGKYGYDTVGEDMELVVRLTRYMREKKLPHKIGYSYNANCWTEVPENMKTLLRQRDRWHRGLIEILSFHQDMLAQKKYGSVGMVAMPYFLLFEMLGPWIELQGYILVLFAALLGIINGQIALLLFIATIMLGVFISVASLIIAQQEVNKFKIREVLSLIGYAVIENFGFRQLMSMWRVAGFISTLRGSRGWGTMARKGFSAKNGGIILFDDELTPDDTLLMPDARDVDACPEGFCALFGTADSDVSTGGVAVYSLDGIQRYRHTINDFSSDYHKATVAIAFSAYAVLGVSEAGCKILSLESGDYLHEIDNPVPGSDAVITNCNSASADGNLLFTANGNYRFRIFKITGNFSSVTRVGYVPFEELMSGEEYYSANHVVFKGNHLFVASGVGGVNIYTFTKK